MQTQNSCWLLWLHPPPSSPTGIVCSMETKLAHSRILISQAWGGDASSWPRSQVSKATRRSLFIFCPSHLTAKPVKTAGTRGGASAGDWGTALQTRLRQVCGGGMFLHVTPWARFLFYGSIKSLGNFDWCVCVCVYFTGQGMWAERGGAPAVPADAPAPGGGSRSDTGGSGSGSGSVLSGERSPGFSSRGAAPRGPEAAELHPDCLWEGGGAELHEKHQAC